VAQQRDDQQDTFNHDVDCLRCVFIKFKKNAMTAQKRDLDVEAFAKEVVACLSNRTQIAKFSSRPSGMTLAQAYRVTPLLRAAFEARGETITGRKIGFTNRQMWKEFGIKSPVWGYATSGTTRNLAKLSAISSSDFFEPRIEPEIMLGIGTTPTPTMSDTALVDCVEWVALGYEIVQSIFPNWKFSAADTVAANGLHGALLIGRRYAFAPRKADWLRELATFEVELFRNGKLAERGGGSLVLGSPLVALRHLIELLANDPDNPPLGAGEIVSTGTLTLAAPVRPGERWTTRVLGIPLEEISILVE
jgi:2-oxo-3-hexenedioate decarboxylase